MYICSYRGISTCISTTRTLYSHTRAVHLTISEKVYSVARFKDAKCSILIINTCSCSSTNCQNDTLVLKMIGSLYLMLVVMAIAGIFALILRVANSCCLCSPSAIPRHYESFSRASCGGTALLFVPHSNSTIDTNLAEWLPVHYRV